MERIIDTASFNLYAKPDFLNDLSHRLDALGAGDRVVIMTMSFDVLDVQVANVMKSLQAAAGRGASVRLFVDAYAFLISDDSQPFSLGPLFLHASLSDKRIGNRIFRASYEALERLKATGGSYVITNIPDRRFSNPFAGRSHLKMVLLNDRVYLGGCNLNDASNIDVMTGWDDAATAKKLYSLADDIAEKTSTRIALQQTDVTLPINDTTSIMLDSGVAGQSLIYDTALEIIENAQKSVFISCQFFPNGRTAACLRRAHARGVAVTIAYNHPSKNSLSFLHYTNIAIERLRMPSEFFQSSIGEDQPFLHAKIIATESEVMIGSHNYVPAGVTLGTAEIALRRKDPIFSEAVVGSLLRQVGWRDRPEFSVLV